MSIVSYVIIFLILILFVLVALFLGNFIGNAVTNLLDHSIPWLFHTSPEKLKAAGIGEKTKFIIDIQDKSYEYYENIIEDWLSYNHFSKYNKKIQGRYLKFYHNNGRFKFGFHYYRGDHSIVIEAWIVTSYGSNPLTLKLDPEPIEIEGQKVYFSILGQHKKEYLSFLQSLIAIPESIAQNICENIQDINYVTLNKQIDYTKIPNQKKEKKKIYLFCFAIIFVSFFIVFVQNFIQNLDKPQPSAQDQTTALNLIQKNYPDFNLEESSTSVDKFSKEEGHYYIISYIFYGTLDTPNSKKDKVMIIMSNSEYNNYTCINEDYIWGANIIEDKEDGQKWDFYLK